MLWIFSLFNYHLPTVCFIFSVSPRITCKNGYAQVGRRNAHVQCEVRARPPVSVLFWVIDDNGTTLTKREVINEHWTIVTVSGI